MEKSNKSNNYFYIKKDALDRIGIMKDGQNAILKDFNNNLGIIIYLHNNEYLIRVAYISGDKCKFKFDYDFSQSNNFYY